MKNKDNLWMLSPSGLYAYDECKACFWLENHHGKAPGIPPVLNMAIDSIFKSRYDSYRKKNELPPEIEKIGAEGVKLFDDQDILDKWRGSTQYLRVVNEKEGYILSGKLDEVLVEKDGRLIPSDFKSSGYMPKEDKQKYYISQLHAYGLMFREHGYSCSDRAILLHYFIKDTKSPSLEVEFQCHIDPVKLDFGLFEKKLKEMVNLLNGPYPGDDLECERCSYHKGRVEKSKIV